MTISPFSIHCVAARLCVASLALGTGAAAIAADDVIATEPVGYISTETVGGTVASPGLTFVSPSLAQPVLWQGQVAAVNGATLTVANADRQTNLQLGAGYMLEIASGEYAGLWSAITSAAGDQVTLTDSLESVLGAGESIRIRRFTTLSDFLGAANEAGLKSGPSLASSDSLNIYHSSGTQTYWYYDGSQGGSAGWYDTAWRPAADTVIAPGEGVVLLRKGAGSVQVLDVGTVTSGPRSVVVSTKRNFIGGVLPADLTLEKSGLYTGSAADGVVGSNSLAGADALTVYGNPIQVYWYYNGSAGGQAGWYDTWWQPANDAILKKGSTFILERKRADAFVWFLPALIP